MGTNVAKPGNGPKCGGLQNWMSQLPGRTYAWYWKCQSNRTFFILNPDSEIEHQVQDFAQRWSACGELL